MEIAIMKSKLLGILAFAVVPLVAIAIVLLPAHNAIADPGIVVTDDLSGALTKEDMVNTLLGATSDAIASNITYTGAPTAAGEFNGGIGIVGFESGTILSSGQVGYVVGPNSFDDTTTSFGTPGDADLDTLVTNTTTFDAAVLEFDFECEGPTPDVISFQYVFSSEEYNEFTNTQFNNVFGFFLNGTNIALLPDNVTPVAINNVNGGHPLECIDGIDNDLDGPIDGADPDCTTPLDNIVGEDNSNSAFFINNDCSDSDGGPPCPIDIESDGQTVVLFATGPANPGVNHIKLAIGDAGDSVLDSWVFIEAGSFQCAPPPSTIEAEKFYTHTNVDFQPTADESSFGDLLPLASDVFDDGYYTPLFMLKAKLKNGKVQNYTPGQYYAVTKVNIISDLPLASDVFDDGYYTLNIVEDFSDCVDQGISIVNPKNAPGGALVVVVDPEGNVTDLSSELAESGALSFNEDFTTAEAVLEGPLEAGSMVYMYVKFRPGLKKEEFPAENPMCRNTETVSIGPVEVVAEADLIVVPRE